MTVATHTSTLDTPTSVKTYFDILNTHGHVRFQPGQTRATLTLTIPGGDLYDLAAKVQQVTRDLSRLDLFPVAPEIPRPTPVDHPGPVYTFTTRIPLPDDAGKFFDILTGQAAAVFDPTQPTTTVVEFDEADGFRLGYLTRGLEEELDCYFPEHLTFSRPIAC